MDVTITRGESKMPASLMDPHHLALFLSAVASVSGKEVLKTLLCLTVGRHSPAEFENLRNFWLPFWSYLVHMDGVPLDACLFAF